MLKGLKMYINIVKSVGKIMPVEIMDKIIDSCEKKNNNCKLIRIQFLNCTQSAYETV